MTSPQTLGNIGEKRLLAEYILPFFNPNHDPFAASDDCTVLSVPNGHVALLTTDRVPSDLIALKLGIIDYVGFGKHVAAINLNNIAACGGTPTGMVLTFAAPPEFLVEHLILLRQKLVSSG